MPVFDERFAFFPLILTVITSAVIFFELIKLSKMRTGKSYLTQFVAFTILAAGAGYTVISRDITYFSLAVFISTVFMIPLYRNLITAAHHSASLEKEKKEISIIADEMPQKASDYQEIDESLLDVSRDFMIHAADAFSEESGLARLLDYINTTLVKVIKADGGAVLLIDDFEDIIAVKSFTGDFPPPYKLPTDLPHKVIRVETNFRFASFPLGETIFGDAAVTGKPELITQPLLDTRFYQNEPEDFLKLGSYLVLPMIIRGTVIGVISLARKIESIPFNEDEFKAAKILTDFACAAVRNVYAFQEIVEHSELTRETELACRIQIRLHPKLLPAIPGLSLGHYFSTAEGVCGDYFDILPSRKDRISFIIADVAGKGMNSLIIMVMIRAIMRLVVNTTQSAATILGWANRGICAESSIDHFASLALINYDSVSGQVEYSTAGTTPVLLYEKSTGEIRRLSSASEPIGVEKTTVYVDNKITVHSGDILITYTDGLIEAVDSSGKQYSVKRLTQVIGDNSNLSGKEIANLVKSDVKKFSGSAHQHDDQTLLVIKIQ